MVGVLGSGDVVGLRRWPKRKFQSKEIGYAGKDPLADSGH